MAFFFNYTLPISKQIKSLTSETGKPAFTISTLSAQSTVQFSFFGWYLILHPELVRCLLKWYQNLNPLYSFFYLFSV
jgi:hypothetical protein